MEPMGIACNSRPRNLRQARGRGAAQAGRGLLRTKEKPNDAEARLSCQLGSWLSEFGLEARVPMGASHAIGHVLGGTCDVPHYFRTAVMMPSVLRYNRPAAEAAQTSIAAALGAGGQDASEALCRFRRHARSAASAHRCRRQRRSL
jgi:maleylacetate reductase